MLKAPDIKTALPGPKAKAIIDKDAKFVSPSYTRDYPLVIARGEGAVVEDVDGREEMVIKPMCYVTLTIDHRVLDGFQANQFLTKFVEVLRAF